MRFFWHRLWLVGVGVWLAVFPGCDAEPPAQDDERLEAAIATGRWSEATREVAAGSVGRYEIDSERYRKELGAFVYEAKASYRYEGDEGVESELDEEVQLTMSQEGRFRLRVERSFRRVDDPPGTSRREAIYDGRRMVTRTGAGRWIAWDPLRRGHARWLREALRHLPVLLGMLEPGLDAKRDGRRVTLGLGKWNAPELPEGLSLSAARHSEGEDWTVWWARSHRPTTVSGTLVMHPDSELFSSADLRFSATTLRMKRPRQVLSEPEVTVGPNPFGWGAAEKNGKTDSSRTGAEAAAAGERQEDAPRARKAKATFTATLRLTIRALETPPGIRLPPASEIHEPRRRRVQHMIDTLIGPGHKP